MLGHSDVRVARRAYAELEDTTAHAAISETCQAFLRAQASSIVASDFLTIETVLLSRLYALVFIELSTRKGSLAGETANPSGDWAPPQARNMIETLTSRPGPLRILIHDRDSSSARPVKTAPSASDRQTSANPRPVPSRTSAPFAAATSSAD